MIERAIFEALSKASNGSKQETQAARLKELLNLLKADGFEDPTPPEEQETLVFNPELRHVLLGEGFLIQSLTAMPLKKLNSQGKIHYWTSWRGNYPEFEMLHSRKSEVAINPQLRFPGTFDEQVSAIAKYNLDFQDKFAGAKAILGEAPDYIEFAFAQLNTTGEKLFGQRDNFFVRTNTRINNKIVNIGNFTDEYGIHVGLWEPNSSNNNLFAVPIIIPQVVLADGSILISS